MAELKIFYKDKDKDKIKVGKENPILNEPIFTKRPEQLSVEEFIELTKLIESL